MSTVVSQYYGTMRNAFESVPPPELEEAAALLYGAAVSGHAIYTFGNGASAALASHMATDIGKGTAHDHGLSPSVSAALRIRISSLVDNAALLTAYGNDVGYEFTFVEQLRGLLNEGDVAIGISGSGASPNVLRALEYARAHGARTIGLTGSMSSAIEMTSRSDIVVCAPLDRIDQIEDMHVSFSHILMRLLDERLALDGYRSSRVVGDLEIG
jgi:D-sedoheptulose 7-phosphate isomerase